MHRKLLKSGESKVKDIVYIILRSYFFSAKNHYKAMINSYLSLQSTQRVYFKQNTFENIQQSFVLILLIRSQMITIELLCKHEPHLCRCKHDTRTQVDRQEVTNELIKHNPALLKYFGKRVQTHLTSNKQVNVLTNDGKNIQEQKIDYPYKSIVQQKGLNYILTKNDVINASQKPPKQQSNRQNYKQHIEENHQQHRIIQKSPQLISKDQEIPKVQHRKQTLKQKQIKKYHKDLKNQSRYLSDTAFRKYFNRQCFQNYGRNNTHDKLDGFVYGNYMKTFNINPHTGQNIPLNQQTFYHALVSGSPQKYELYNKEVKLGLTQQRMIEKYRQKSLQKLNVEKMLQNNIKHSKLEQKYSHIKLKSNQSISRPMTGSISPKYASKNINQIRQQKEENTKQKQDNNNSKVPSHLQINTRKYFNEEKSPNKKSIFSPKHDKLANDKHRPTIDLVPNITSVIVQAQPEKLTGKNQVGTIKKAESINKQSSLKVIKQGNAQSPKNLSCTHESGKITVECACCVNRMKQFIIQLSEKDLDLADRIVNSAKKSTMYKNFALNNFQNAAMNPKNYRSIDGKLNIYEQS